MTHQLIKRCICFYVHHTILIFCFFLGKSWILRFKNIFLNDIVHKLQYRIEYCLRKNQFLSFYHSSDSVVFIFIFYIHSTHKFF